MSYLLFSYYYSLKDGICCDALDKLVTLDEHVFVQVLLTLTLIELECKLVRVHRLLFQGGEALTKVAVDIRLLVAILGHYACQLPDGRLVIFALALIVFLEGRLDLAEEVESCSTVSTASLSILGFQVKEAIVVLKNVVILLVEECHASVAQRDDMLTKVVGLGLSWGLCGIILLLQPVF